MIGEAFGIKSEQDAENWLDLTIPSDEQKRFYGREFRLLGRMNYMYGNGLRQTLKDVLYKITVENATSIAEMRAQVANAEFPEKDDLLSKNDDGEFLLNYIKLHLETQWENNPAGLFTDTWYATSYGIFALECLMVVWFRGWKWLLIALANGIWASESFYTVHQKVSGTGWGDADTISGISIMTTNIQGLLLASPQYGWNSTLFSGGVKAIISFLHTIFTIYNQTMLIARDPPVFSKATRTPTQFLNGKMVSHTAHAYGFFNGASLPAFVHLIKRWRQKK